MPWLKHRQLICDRMLRPGLSRICGFFLSWLINNNITVPGSVNMNCFKQTKFGFGMNCCVCLSQSLKPPSHRGQQHAGPMCFCVCSGKKSFNFIYHIYTTCSQCLICKLLGGGAREMCCPPKIID